MEEGEWLKTFFGSRKESLCCLQFIIDFYELFNTFPKHFIINFIFNSLSKHPKPFWMHTSKTLNLVRDVDTSPILVAKGDTIGFKEIILFNQIPFSKTFPSYLSLSLSFYFYFILFNSCLLSCYNTCPILLANVKPLDQLR